MDGPERGVLNIDHESLGSGLVPAVDLVDRSYPPSWDAHSLEPGENISGCEGGERIFEHSDDVVTPFDSLPVGPQSFVIIQPELRSELLPLGVVSTCDLDSTAPAPEQPVRDD